MLRLRQAVYRHQHADGCPFHRVWRHQTYRSFDGATSTLPQTTPPCCPTRLIIRLPNYAKYIAGINYGSAAYGRTWGENTLHLPSTTSTSAPSPVHHFRRAQWHVHCQRYGTRSALLATVREIFFSRGYAKNHLLG